VTWEEVLEDEYERLSAEVRQLRRELAYAREKISKLEKDAFLEDWRTNPDRMGK
jgi:molecular chaperone GrpE (heat shock protein)